MSDIPLPGRLRLLFEIEGTDADSAQLRLRALLGANALKDIDSHGENGEDTYRIWMLSASFDRVYELRFLENEVTATRVTKLRDVTIARVERLILPEETGEHLRGLLKSEVAAPLPLQLHEPKVFYSASSGTVIEGIQGGTPVWAIRK